jgi:hypothetical protein
MKRRCVFDALSGPVDDDVAKKWKFSSLKDGEVWTFGYEFLPNEVFFKLTECILNKPCLGRDSRTIKRYKKITITELKKWLELKQTIPREIAQRISAKVCGRDLRRLKLAEAVSFAELGGGGTINSYNNLTTDHDTAVLEEVDLQHMNQESSTSSALEENIVHPVVDININADNEMESADDDEAEYLATHFSTLEQIAPVIRYDSSGNELDPMTGFPKPRCTLAKVLRHWKKRELSVSKGSLNRLLKDLHTFQPEISKQDYAEKTLPRKAETLLQIPESEHKYHIRRFCEYDYVKDDWPEKNNEDSYANDESDDNRKGSEDDSSTDDDDDDDNDDDGVSGEYDETPKSADYDADMKSHRVKEDAKAKSTSSDIHQMVYFGLENILTCSNSAGNIQKGPYFNYLRAIALFDPHALTDAVVDRLFPKNCKVRTNFLDLVLSRHLIYQFFFTFFAGAAFSWSKEEGI